MWKTMYLINFIIKSSNLGVVIFELPLKKDIERITFYIFFNFSLSEFKTTVTDEKLIAIPAYIGVNITPRIG